MMAVVGDASPWALLLLYYGVIELAFYVMYKWVWLPRANANRIPSPYRPPYTETTQRKELIVKILTRILSGSHSVKEQRVALTQFLLAWLRPLKETTPLQRSQKKALEREDTSVTASDTSSEGNHGEGTTMSWTIPGVSKETAQRFLAWAMFDAHYCDLSTIERDQVEHLFVYLYQTLQLEFYHGHSTYEPRLLTLEAVRPWHRPLLLYGAFYAFAFFVSLLLRHVFGFAHFTTPAGVQGWYRTGHNKHHDSLTPLVFFHGIAPGGVSGYVPFILSLIRGGRPCVLIANNNISCRFGLEAVSEQQLVEGVTYIVDTLFGKHQRIIVAGHSFGSCNVSWLHNDTDFRKRIAQYVLLDPVSILLSESDVMINFLYSQEVYCKIRIIASSELFIEHYLRRKFSWYNSEMWLDELDTENSRVLLCLSKGDEIVPAPKVRAFAQAYDIRQIFWENVGHGSCITDPSKWEEIYDAMLSHEQELRSTKKVR